MPHRRQPPRHARGFEAAGVELAEVVAQRLRLDRGEGLAAASQEFGEIREVAAIGLQRVGACALFRREHVEEQVDQLGV